MDLFRIETGGEIAYTYYLKRYNEAVVFKDGNKLGMKKSKEVFDRLLLSIGARNVIVSRSRMTGNFNKRELLRAMTSFNEKNGGSVKVVGSKTSFNGFRPDWIAYDELANL